MKYRALVVFCLVSTLVGLPFASAEEEDEGMWARIKRHDKNGDGKVTKEEMGRGGRMFDRMDADGDGAISKDEAKAMPMRGGRGGRGGGPGGPMSGMPGGMRGGLALEKIDTNKDGAISTAEWESFFEKADENEDGTLQKEEWEAAVGGGRMKDPAPKVGSKAPQVLAQLRGATEKVDLGALKRTTVLIFGSWT